jgi:tRNA(fMet)-specific endonuclease VapC
LSGFLLDTNVLSEVIKKRPDAVVLQRLRSVPGEALFTSVVCITELRFGALRHPRGRALWKRIEAEVLPRVRVLPLSMGEALRAGDLLAELAGRGEPIGVEDVLIAATALEGGLTAVTRNLKHFSRIPGLAMESWWEPPSSDP